jgi:hypothetical protein
MPSMTPPATSWTTFSPSLIQETRPFSESLRLSWRKYRQCSSLKLRKQLLLIKQAARIGSRHGRCVGAVALALRGCDKLILKARKAAALADAQPPINTAADAKLEREAKDEERAINKICNELGLEMHEVLTPSPPPPLNSHAIDLNPSLHTHTYTHTYV